MTSTWMITGSSVGLGREIVEAALAAGHNVVGTARNLKTLADFEARFPDRFLAQLLDVTDENQARNVVDAAIDRFGRIDVLVNNAGFSGMGSVEDIPLELVTEQFSTNFIGALNSVKAVLPGMRSQGSGHIILVSSIGARIAAPGAGLYFATKAAVSAMAETLALEVAPFGIHVTAVEPGGMKTRFAEQASLKVSPYNSVYEDTVGATLTMMRSPEYNSQLHDPAGHASMIVKLAEADAPPVRIMAGGDSYDLGVGADAAQRASDVRWEALSRSASAL